MRTVYMIQGALIALIAVAAFTLLNVRDWIAPKGFEVAKIEARKAEGKKRIVVYRTGAGLFKRAGELSAMDVVEKTKIAKEIGGKVVEQPENLNAFVVEADDLNEVSLPEGWAVQEDQVVHMYDWSPVKEAQAETLYRIVPASCDQPSPSPSPTPTPVPVPTPNPTPGDERVDWGNQMIHAREAQAVVAGRKPAVGCIIDTGVDKSHPDLQGRILGGRGFTTMGTDYQDQQGHGTHVAGIMSAICGNGRDVCGVSTSPFYMAQVLDRSGSGMESWIANGISYCVQMGAKVINSSLGADQRSQVISTAVANAIAAGVIFVAAAGNNSGKVGYPGADPGVVTVSSIDQNGQPSNFTSRGPEVDWQAPGGDILSLKLGGGTTKMSGTSMASPAVAGVYLLAVTAGKTDAKGVNTNQNPYFMGRGRIDAFMSVQP